MRLALAISALGFRCIIYPVYWHLSVLSQTVQFAVSPFSSRYDRSTRVLTVQFAFCPLNVLRLRISFWTLALWHFNLGKTTEPPNHQNDHNNQNNLNKRETETTETNETIKTTEMWNNQNDNALMFGSCFHHPNFYDFFPRATAPFYVKPASI